MSAEVYELILLSFESFESDNKHIKFIDLALVEDENKILKVSVCTGEVESTKGGIWPGSTPFNRQQNQIWLAYDLYSNWTGAGYYFNFELEWDNDVEYYVNINFTNMGDYVYNVQEIQIDEYGTNSYASINYNEIYEPNQDITSPEEGDYYSQMFFYWQGIYDETNFEWNNVLVFDYRDMNKFYNQACYLVGHFKPHDKKEGIHMDITNKGYDYWPLYQYKMRDTWPYFKVTYASKVKRLDQPINPGD